MLRLPFLLLALPTPSRSCSARAEVSVANRQRHPLSPHLFGAFIEELNFVGDGGLFAEQIRNPGFEALGRGNLGELNHSRCTSWQWAPPPWAGPPPCLPDHDDFRPWSAEALCGLPLAVSLDNSTHPFPTNPVALRVGVGRKAGCEGGVVLRNPGFWGIAARPSLTFRLEFWASTTAPIAVSPTLWCPALGRSITTAATLSVVGPGWAPHAVSLRVREGCDAAVLSLTLAGSGGGAVTHFDGFSLMPGDAVAGIFRRDVFEAISALRPTFLRFPGGSFLEGYTFETRWNWQNAIGPRAARPGHFNSAWGYWCTDHMGLPEYLLFAELVGADAQMSVYDGYSIYQEYVPLNRSQVFAQDALDALEYAKGSATSKYGRVRVADGHAAPFRLPRMEIGNEEGTTPDYQPLNGYRNHYDLVANAIRSHDPSVKVIASAACTWQASPGPSTAPAHCMNGSAKVELWDTHYYGTVAEMEAMNSTFDYYPRSLPPFIVGEYSAGNVNW